MTETKPVKIGLVAYIVAAVFLYIIIAVLAVPITYFTMLFLGNVDVNLGFWDILPGTIALSTLISRGHKNG